jgi:hypothetical protein
MNEQGKASDVSGRQSLKCRAARMALQPAGAGGAALRGKPIAGFSGVGRLPSSPAPPGVDSLLTLGA